MTLRSFAPLVVLLAVAGACSEKVQQRYDVRVVGPFGLDYLAGAVKGELELVHNGVVDKLATTSIRANAPFSLTGTGVDVKAKSPAVLRFKALDAAGNLVVWGQSPEIELALATPPELVIFTQKPGSFGRAFDLDYPRRQMVSATIKAAVSSASLARPIDLAFIGLGTATVKDAMNVETERPSEVFRVYNPLVHAFEDAGLSGAIGGVRQPRTEGSATVINDRVLVFGGLAAPLMMEARPTGQLDLVQAVRTGFDKFETRTEVRGNDAPGVPRMRAAMIALTGTALAIGGRAGDQVLDTAVLINPASGDTFRLLPEKMAGPREGHTASTVSVVGGEEVLIFGGSAPGVAVAEVLASSTLKFEAAKGDLGPARRDHGAVVLPGNDRVLIIGGRNDGGVIGDSRLYRSSDRTLAVGPITLQKPRYGFAVFVIGDDLVVAGGFDANNAAIGDAEVFKLADLSPRAVVPATARGGAAVSVLPNQMALLMGGTGADGKATSVVEIYQPHR